MSAPPSSTPSAVDWSRFDAVTDAAWFAEARLVLPAPKRQVTLRLDADLPDWFRAQGPGWQTRMNAVLRAWMQAQKPAR